jgi:hypothetical protein
VAKNVLIIAFHYPPQSNGGVQRPYAFAKYLKKNGYNVFVITADYFKFNNPDHERNIYRVKAFDDSLKGKSIISKLFILSIRIIRKALYKLGFIFIDNFYWYWNVKREMGKILLQTNPDVIFSTFRPLNCLLLGLYIKIKYNIPLISDFRDGFLFESLEKFNIFQRLSTKFFEKKVVKNSTAIITVSPPITKYFKEKYHFKNLSTIYNGFDVEDRATIDLSTRKVLSDKFRTIYFGGFGTSRKRDIKPFFLALAKLREDKIFNSTNFELRIYGRLTAEELYQIEKYKISDILIYQGYIDRMKGLELMETDCDALLFYGDPCSSCVVSSKLMEYIFMNKPILGICKGNEAENIINRTKTGLVTDFTVEGIMEGFKKIINYDDFWPDWDEINYFSREKQIKELIQVIEEVCPSNS